MIVYRAYLSNEHVLENTDKKALGKSIAWTIAILKEECEEVTVEGIETDNDYLYRKG